MAYSRVVGSNPDDTLVRESGETDSSSGVGDKVEEGSGSGDDQVGTVSSESVHDCT